MRSRLFAVVSILLGFGISLLALEIALRVAAPNWLHERMKELNAGVPYEFGTDQAWPIVHQSGTFHQFVPNSRFMVRHYEYQHAVMIDELGGRSTPYTPGNSEMIPFMGDSFTFGVGVRDSETFVSLVAGQTAHRFLNLGVPGSSLHNQIDIVKSRHSALGKPKMYIFCMFMGNDLADIRKRYKRSTLVKAGDAISPEQSLLWRINSYIFHHPIFKQTYSIQFIRQKILIMLNQQGIGRMNPIFQIMRTDTHYLEESVRYFREELKRLGDVSKRLHFGYVFVLIPDVHQVNSRRFELKRAYYGLNARILEPKRVSREISASLRHFGIPHIDISECFSSAENPDRLYFVQDNHFTAAGHDKAARCLLGSGLMGMISR